MKQLPSITPVGSERWEIRGGVAAEVLADLRKRPGVHEATIFGQAVHALIDNDVSLKDLERKGLALSIAEPNLEDVFVTLARQQAIKVGLK